MLSLNVFSLGNSLNIGKKEEKISTHQYCDIGRIINKVEIGQNYCESGDKFLNQNEKNWVWDSGGAAELSLGT